MSAIFTRPITAANFPAYKARKFLEPSTFFARRLHFLGELHCRKSVSWNICRINQRIVKGDDWVRVSTRDEGIPAFEQGALVEESREGGGLEDTLNNASKRLVAVVLTATLIWRHDAEALWAFMGSAINNLLSVALKQVLNQERPDSKLRSDPGMPSSHAQTITYTTMLLILSIVEFYGINWWTTTLSGILIVVGYYLTWLRVSHKFHTVSQVVVGALVASMFFILWFWLWNAYVMNLFSSTLWAKILVVAATAGFSLASIIRG